MRMSLGTALKVGCLAFLLMELSVLGQSAPPSLSDFRQAVLALNGNVDLGRQLYENSERSRCKLCHAIEGVGSIIGPDLLGVGARYDRASLLDSILEPSAKIHPDYAATVIVTKAGKVLTGIARQINENDVEIVISEKEKIRIGVDEIAERKPSLISAMPAGLHEKISPTEMANLLSFLAKLKSSAAGSRQEALDPQEIPRAIEFVKFNPIIDQKLAFQRPVWFGSIPGSPDNSLVLEIDRGRIWRLEGQGTKARRMLFVDLNAETTGGEFTGLMSLAFHPDFARNRRYFLKLHASPPEGRPKTRENALVVNIIERKASVDGLIDSGEPSKIRMQIPCFSVFHHGGDLAFGPDGFLYSTMGDTGPQGDPNGHGQDLNELWGKLFRIDVDKTERDLPYAIPLDNPFRNHTGARPEIWALGFRELWRFSFDPVTGDLWAGDVGQNRFEEIMIVRPGENYGWNVMEGFQPYSDRYRTGSAKYIPPVFAYGHAIGPSVTGGFVYRGARYPALQGKYVFGDYETRRVWALEQQDRKTRSIVEIGRAPDHISSFGVDAEGEIYAVGLDQGMIYHINAENADITASTAREIARTSLESSETWRHSVKQPAPDWTMAGFDDTGWVASPGSFGKLNPKQSAQPVLVSGPQTIRTEWNSSEIWLRRTISFAPRASNEGERSDGTEGSIFKLLVNHEGDAEIYLNGLLAAQVSGKTTGYEEIPLLPDARNAIKKGTNLLAAHCRKVGTSQQIDVGLIELQKTR